MENKITKSNVIPSLLINSVKNKKSWFLLSTIIILVTTLLIPFILKTEINDNSSLFIVFGIVETFVIVFINCMIDNSLWHNDSKLAYYKSKPVAMTTQIAVNILINVIFTAFLLVLLAIAMKCHKSAEDDNLFEIFKVIIPWLSAGIFLAALSSVLTGNTIVAAAMTVFNFLLPAIIYLIIMFVFTILENMVIGFSANVLMDYFVDAVYKLNYIYFYEYTNKSVDFIYILILAVILIGISLITLNCIKKRKNENTGNFIVFDGYKYFVSVLASLIVPSALSQIYHNNAVVSKIIVSAIMALLSYYILIAIMEKSFKISKYSIKVFAVSMVLFVSIAGGAIAFANQYKNVVPNIDDVQLAYVGTDNSIYNSIALKKYMEINISEVGTNDEFLKWQRNNSLVIFTERDSIENITSLHKELLKNQNYKHYQNYHMDNLIIAYWMKDGSIIVRDYTLNIKPDSLSDNQNKDEIAYRILNSQEMKKRKYYYLYDENYYKGKNIYCTVSERFKNQNIIDNINIDDIRDYLIRDIDKQYSQINNPFTYLLSHNYDRQYLREDNEDNHDYYLEIRYRVSNDKNKAINHIDEIPLFKDYNITLDYLGLTK